MQSGTILSPASPVAPAALKAHDFALEESAGTAQNGQIHAEKQSAALKAIHPVAAADTAFADTLEADLATVSQAMIAGRGGVQGEQQLLAKASGSLKTYRAAIAEQADPETLNKARKDAVIAFNAVHVRKAEHKRQAADALVLSTQIGIAAGGLAASCLSGGIFAPLAISAAGATGLGAVAVGGLVGGITNGAFATLVAAGQTLGARHQGFSDAEIEAVFNPVKQIRDGYVFGALGGTIGPAAQILAGPLKTGAASLKALNDRRELAWEAGKALQQGLQSTDTFIDAVEAAANWLKPAASAGKGPIARTSAALFAKGADAVKAAGQHLANMDDAARFSSKQVFQPLQEVAENGTKLVSEAGRYLRSGVQERLSTSFSSVPASIRDPLRSVSHLAGAGMERGAWLINKVTPFIVWPSVTLASVGTASLVKGLADGSTQFRLFPTQGRPLDPAEQALLKDAYVTANGHVAGLLQEKNGSRSSLTLSWRDGFMNWKGLIPFHAMGDPSKTWAEIGRGAGGTPAINNSATIGALGGRAFFVYKTTGYDGALDARVVGGINLGSAFSDSTVSGQNGFSQLLSLAPVSVLGYSFVTLPLPDGRSLKAGVANLANPLGALSLRASTGQVLASRAAASTEGNFINIGITSPDEPAREGAGRLYADLQDQGDKTLTALQQAPDKASSLLMPPALAQPVQPSRAMTGWAALANEEHALPAAAQDERKHKVAAGDTPWAYWKNSGTRNFSRWMATFKAENPIYAQLGFLPVGEQVVLP